MRHPVVSAASLPMEFRIALFDQFRELVFQGVAVGFESFGGNPDQGWLMLRSGPTVIGLFQGMFERNSLTFNPGWNQQAETLPEFTDVRELRARVEAAGLEILSDGTGESGSGPAYFTLVDPDGNPVLIDQHV